MTKKMNSSEVLRETAEDNAYRKVLLLLNECENITEAKTKINALINR